MAILSIQDSIASAIARAGSVRSSGATSSVSAATDTEDTAPVSSSSPQGAILSSVPRSSQQSAALHNATVAFAQLGSTLQVAQASTRQAGSLLEQLQGLAGQATQSGSDATLATLDSEFQPILAQLDQLTSSASFGGSALLDGSLSSLPTDPTTTDASVTPPASQPASGNPLPSLPPLPNLSTQSLFGVNVPSLLTSADASDALSAVTSALSQVASAQTAIASTQNQVGFATAVADSVFANQVAAQSYIGETDTQTDSSSTDLQSLLSSDPGASVQTQTGNLLPGLLALLRD